MSDVDNADFGGGNVVALCGGVGGAKLALGLSRILGERLTVIVNTADDFEHLGLKISPDLDTVLYTLSGLANTKLGWGREDETWNFMDTLRQMGSETWFQLGDRDLALHVERTRYLAKGGSLTSFMGQTARRLGITSHILPMSDNPVRTCVHTVDGPLEFQRYFVEHRCGPVVEKLTFEGAGDARPTWQVIKALGDPALSSVIIAPSNPYLSIDPILSVRGMTRLLKAANVPVVAVSPIIGGKAVKGPTDKIMAELGLEPTSKTIEAHYRDLLTGLVIDTTDAGDADGLELPYQVTSTWMKTQADREKLARDVLTFAGRLALPVAENAEGA